MDAVDTARDTDPMVRVEVDADGIGWLSIGSRTGKARVGLATLRAFERAIAELEAPLGASGVRAIVLVADSMRHDLDSYAADEVAVLDEDGVSAWSLEAQRILNWLERLPVPSVAAIEGIWLGSAAEVALACSYRVSRNHPSAGIGFPQACLDLLPAWGATVRIQRLTDVVGSTRVLIRGETLDSAAARGLGIVDRIIPAAGFRARVSRFALRMARREHHVPLSDRPIKRGILEGSRGGRRLVLRRVARRYLAGADASRSEAAVPVALELLARSESLSPERAFALEAALAARVMTSDDARGRLHAQRCMARVSEDVAGTVRVIRSAAVLGSSRTAADLGALLAGAGVMVRVKDERRDLAAACVAVARGRIEWERAQGRISAVEAGRRSARLSAVTGYGGFGTLDLVVSADNSAEAAWNALRACRPHVDPACVLTIHTLAATAHGTGTAEAGSLEAIGLALSLPADRFPLLEIMADDSADRASVDALRRLGSRVGLTAVRVPARGPSPATRLLATYFAEASRLVDEGATVAQVDAAAERFGFEVGPFRRMDAMGADRAYELVATLGDMTRRARAEPTLDSGAPSAHWLGRFAREARTFYNYRSGVPRQPNSLLPPGLSPDGETIDHLIQRRLSLALTGEAIRILEAGDVAEASLLEVIALHALGYPLRRGGLLFQARLAGHGALLVEFEAAEALLGARFTPPGLLKEWVNTEQGGRGVRDDAGSGQPRGFALRSPA